VPSSFLQPEKVCSVTVPLILCVHIASSSFRGTKYALDYCFDPCRFPHPTVTPKYLKEYFSVTIEVAQLCLNTEMYRHSLVVNLFVFRKR
jgi:hypothetical protein